MDWPSYVSTQKNGTPVSSNPTLNFIDVSGGITWTITNNPTINSVTINANLPQAISTASSPQFAGLAIGGPFVSLGPQIQIMAADGGATQSIAVYGVGTFAQATGNIAFKNAGNTHQYAAIYAATDIGPNGGLVLNATTSGGVIHTPNFTGIGVFPTSRLQLGGNISAVAWGTAAISFRSGAASYTDTTSSGTVTDNHINGFGTPTLLASNASVYTNASTVYIGGAPVASTNVTVTNPWALYVASGKTFLSGSATIGTSANAYPAGVPGLPSNTLTLGASGGSVSLALYGIDSSTSANGTAITYNFNYQSSGTPYTSAAQIAFYRANPVDGDFGAGMQFWTRTNGSSNTERMRIDNLGRVGIGSTNPQAPLYVQTSVPGLTTVAAFRNISTGGRGLFINVNADSQIVALDASGDAGSTLAFRCGGIDTLKIDTVKNIVLNPSGSLLAQNSTAGFTYIPGFATGKPNGTPSTVYTGAFPFGWDSVNSKIVIWNGSGWVSTAALT